MNIDQLREFCLSIKGATEDMSFKDPYLVFRVMGKWFAVVPLQDPELKINLKCDPDQAIDLRDLYQSVQAAWHFNKKYWNAITLNRDMNDEILKQWIRHSVVEVVKKLPQKVQEEYWEYKK
jgi:predicted DNA-binding protein (MmcQ/YjbR family)